MNNKFRYYNHALVSNLPDHETLEFTKEELKEAFKEKKKALFLVYTSHFDCGFDSGYYYCINDQGLGFFENLSRHRRKNLRKALDCIKCKVIEVDAYRKDIFNIEEKCIENNKMKKHYNYSNNKKFIYIGAFFEDNNELVGFKCIERNQSEIYFLTEKVNPDYNKYFVSFVLSWYVLKNMVNFPHEYVCAGTKNISHITNHQQYLLDNLGFRFVYCKLNIIYRNFLILSFVRLVSIFKPLLKLFRNNNLVNNIYGVVEFDSIYRKQRKMFKNV